MMITCLIRYQIDPTKRDLFRRYAEAWTRIIPRCGGDLIGYSRGSAGPSSLLDGDFDLVAIIDPTA